MKGTNVGIHPLDDRVVIEPEEGEKMSRGGIHIPDQAQQKPQRGKVLAVGPGRMLDNGERVKPFVMVGDTILFTKYAGNDVEHGGKTVTVLHETDVLAVID